MAQEAWRAYLELAIGATEATRKKATKAVQRLVGKGVVSAGQVQGMAEELIRTSLANREAMTKLVRYEVDRALGAVGLATAEEVGSLTERVQSLEAKLRATSMAPAVAPAEPVGAEVLKKAAPVKKVAVKKVAPVKAEPALVKKVAPVKKTVAKKAPAKKAG
jgi:polyhydroxyalkanoate synthesis regulator phasin